MRDPDWVSKPDVMDIMGYELEIMQEALEDIARGLPGSDAQYVAQRALDKVKHFPCEVRDD